MLRYKCIEIFTSENTRWQGQPIAGAIVRYVNSLKIAARTIVTRGVEGSYENGDIATQWIEVLSFNMPVRIIVILPESELETILTGIQEMVVDGIIALRDLDVICHKTSGSLIPKNILVREIMTPGPASVLADSSLDKVAKILLSSTFTGVPVVDEYGLPVGVIALGDLIYRANLPMRIGLLAASEKSAVDSVLHELGSRPARDIMSHPAVVIGQDKAVTEAVRLMLEKNVKRLPVVNASGKLVGILSRLDVFNAMVQGRPNLRSFQEKNIRVENLKYVSDIVRSDACTVHPDTPVDEVIRVIDSNDIERVCVVDSDGFFLGLISDRDLLFAFADRHPGIRDYLTSKIPFTEKGRVYRELQEHLKAKTAAEVMKAQVVTVRDDSSLDEAIRIMLEKVIKRLPVVDKDGRYKGIVSRDSLLRAGFDALSHLP
jgi:CBS domain-containing protein